MIDKIRKSIIYKICGIVVGILAITAFLLPVLTILMLPLLNNMESANLLGIVIVVAVLMPFYISIYICMIFKYILIVVFILLVVSCCIKVKKESTTNVFADIGFIMMIVFAITFQPLFIPMYSNVIDNYLGNKGVLQSINKEKFKTQNDFVDQRL